MTEYKLPNLPYAHKDLEPFLTEEIMLLHHKTHHQTYINNLNISLKLTEYPECNIGELIILITKDVSLEQGLKDKLLFNAGGHYNHSLYWKCMDTKTTSEPNIPLTKQIEKDFGSLENLKKEFLAAAGSVLGIGWQFLCYDYENKKLVLHSTFQQGTPLCKNLFPILACDLWEHAWYLKFRANKKDFLAQWMTIINWENVSVFYDMAVKKRIVDFISDGKVDLFFGSDNSDKSNLQN